MTTRNPKTGFRDGGSRGGQDQFNWADVKSDKDRENYLGHSQFSPVGRWQKGKDLLWYTRSQGSTPMSAEEARTARRAEAAAERASLQAQEDDLIAEQLGLSMKKRRAVDTKLEAHEVTQLLERGTVERDRLDIERVQGLGAAATRRHEHIEKATLVERELARQEREARAREHNPNELDLDALRERERAGAEAAAGDEPDDAAEPDDARRQRKRERKEAKRAKKEAKKAKKRARKESKAARHDAASSSDSD